MIWFCLLVQTLLLGLIFIGSYDNWRTIQDLRKQLESIEYNQLRRRINEKA